MDWQNFVSKQHLLSKWYSQTCISTLLTFNICLAMASISNMKIKVGEVKPVKDLIVITIVVCRLWLQSLRVNVQSCILYMLSEHFAKRGVLSYIQCGFRWNMNAWNGTVAIAEMICLGDPHLFCYIWGIRTQCHPVDCKHITCCMKTVRFS